MKCEPTEIPEVLLITPDVFNDPRGFFMETYHYKRYAESGLDRRFLQDNYSHSKRGILRGLHYQLAFPQAKLVSVVWGTIFDIAVDVRVGSPNFGKWVGQTLSDENRCQLFIPEGFAHGFCVLSESADVMYKCTDYYHAEDDCGVLWSDPDVGIEWPVDEPLISDKDLKHPRLAEVPKDRLPQYGNT